MSSHPGQVEEQHTAHDAIAREIQSAAKGIRRALGILASASMGTDEPPAAPLIEAQFEVKGIIAALTRMGHSTAETPLTEVIARNKPFTDWR
jgi:hypothetical protein